MERMNRVSASSLIFAIVLLTLLKGAMMSDESSDTNINNELTNYQYGE